MVAGAIEGGDVQRDTCAHTWRARASDANRGAAGLRTVTWVALTHPVILSIAGWAGRNIMQPWFWMLFEDGVPAPCCIGSGTYEGASIWRASLGHETYSMGLGTSVYAT